MTMPARVSLAHVLDASIAFTAADAVAIIVQLARSPQTGRPLPVQLDPGHVWLEDTGAVTLTPGLMPRLSEFAGLLEQLLRPMDEAVPHGLRVVVERARGHEAAPTMPSLTAFAAALAAFQPEDPAAAVRALLARVDGPRAVAPAPPVPPRVPRIAAAAPVTPARITAAPVTARQDERAVWRPSRGHVGGAIAAALLAAVIGGAVGRWRDGDVPPTSSRPSAPPPAVSQRGPHPAPEPEMDAPPAAAAPAARAERPAVLPAPPSSPAAREPIAARPARLVDRRDVQADAVFSPSFATSGTAVFFHAESDGGSALKRADAGGGELRVASIVDDGARNYHVQLSPDGRHVAFDSDRDGVRGVYVADAQGRNVHRVSGPGYAAVPTWSPDGRRLAFLRAEDGAPAVWNLWLLDRESGRQARVTSFRRGQVWGGAWFADGQRLAYSHEDRLVLHDLATGRGREIASPLPGRLVRTPAVSPDGRWIVFQVYRDGVWLFDVDRGRMQRILDDATAEEFAWSPDGRRVAYHSRRSGGWNLWTMAVP